MGNNSVPQSKIVPQSLEGSIYKALINKAL
nr:MAG TPA: hypothetical protein [Caudoviricetes sp.]